MSNFWDEAKIRAIEAEKNEILGNYELAFSMYKAAIVSLLSGVQENDDVELRMHVKEKTAQYLLRAEWIFNNHLVFQNRLCESNDSAQVPWRSRSQLKRYKIQNVLDSLLLVQDISDCTFVVVKGVLKSGDPIDRSETCILPTGVPYMVKLFALHETDTTVYFVLEHVRYGKLWNHLEHYFTSFSIGENLDTELTCTTSQEHENRSSENDVSLNSSDSSNNDLSLSKLESSIYTDTLSCESLSSHDENYFDLIEDFARAKVQKLKEIQDFNERRKHIATLRPVKKTVSQLDLKSMSDSFEQHRSHSLTNLSCDQSVSSTETPSGKKMAEWRRRRRGRRRNSEKITGSFDSSHESYDDEPPSFWSATDKDDEQYISAVDLDTQQLLKNAQKLIDSINETLAKSESVIGSEKRLMNEPIVTNDDCQTKDRNREPDSYKTTLFQNVRHIYTADSVNETVNEHVSNFSQFASFAKDSDACSPISTISLSIPSVTEEYSVTAFLQRKGITDDLITKWASEILIALDVLHRNGIICKDLNPANILLSDNGSIKLTYFFRYPNVERPINVYAKERLYVAPEVLTLHSSVTFASDWWSFGAILFELVTLQSLYDSHPGGIQSHTTINIPDSVPLETRTLLLELLRYNPNERLGSGICGADDIKAHPFFSRRTWQDM